MQPDQTAEAIGPHRLLCGDITSGAVSRLMKGEKADVIYSDPPWGPGNLQYWSTMNQRGSVPRENWPKFLRAIAQACAVHRTPESYVFLEMGLRWTDELDAAMKEVGLPLRRRWRIFYGPRKQPLPNSLALYGPMDLDIEVPEYGEPVTRAVLSAVVRPGTVVLDPCTGLGMTARNTHRLGGRFRGTELNPARLERTAAWLRKRA